MLIRWYRKKKSEHKTHFKKMDVVAKENVHRLIIHAAHREDPNWVNIIHNKLPIIPNSRSYDTFTFQGHLHTCSNTHIQRYTQIHIRKIFRREREISLKWKNESSAVRYYRCRAMVI